VHDNISRRASTIACGRFDRNHTASAICNTSGINDDVPTSTAHSATGADFHGTAFTN
jgi:hypothetical protein